MTDQRARILEHACELFVADGLDGFSMRKLARTLDVSAPALYRHFDSKEKLLLEVTSEAFKLFSQYLYRSLEARTPDERMRLTGQGYLDFALEHPRLYEVIHLSAQLMGSSDCRGSSTSEAAMTACATGQFLVDRVRECMDAKLLRAGEPEQVAITIWAHSHGLVSLYLRGVLAVDEAAFRTLFAESGRRLIMGLGEPSAQWITRVGAEQEEAAKRGAA